MKTFKFQLAEWNTNSTTRKVYWRDFIWMSHHKVVSRLKIKSYITAYTNSLDSSFHAASAFRITWFGRVCEFVFPPFVSATSPKCIDREGLWGHRTRARQELDNTPCTYYNKAAYYPCRPKTTQTLETELRLTLSSIEGSHSGSKSRRLAILRWPCSHAHISAVDPS